jgi:hypothetical protein
LIANARFLSVFSKEDIESKNHRSEENQIIRSKLKSGNFPSKMLLSENLEVTKRIPSREKKSKKCKSVKMHRLLKGVVVANQEGHRKSP